MGGVLRKANKTCSIVTSQCWHWKYPIHFPELFHSLPLALIPWARHCQPAPARSQAQLTAHWELFGSTTALRSQRAQWHTAHPQPHTREISCATEASQPGTCPQTLACGYTCRRKNRADVREVSLGLSQPTDDTATWHTVITAHSDPAAGSTKEQNWWHLGLQKGIESSDPTVRGPGESRIHLPKMLSKAPSASGQWLVGAGLL